ncbi:MAG TPA: hypothetical protein VH187_04185 [Scandinavium sp.]|jgi:hypothetical protein|uniref:hypothetical protein n=1 Tax=Scandinavium sp. TaxID=2830653 RepID=UPI002E331469|nr:hypothetical protein [Scandinavium sp.]HEX4500359.1 hypothetical protein [Scandinavium sp.]
MSAKARFLKKLQENQPRSGAFRSRYEADIAEFCERMEQLRGQMAEWLTDTGIQIENSVVPVVELLVGGTPFNVPGVVLVWESRKIKFTPLFLYGQGVTGCVEASLFAEGDTWAQCRLFMRSTENSGWTWQKMGPVQGQRRVFSEDAFFDMIDGLLA